MSYLFSSESVSEGHPDKVSDQVSDALLDQFLAYDDKAHCAIETFCTTGQLVIMGEVTSDAYIDLQTVARNTINNIGYTKAEYQFDGSSCGILSAIHEQSDDISRGVDNGDDENQGAGDQGMMFGYATTETDNYMPVSLALSHLIMRILADIRKEGKQMTYLRPDAKAQVTIEYSDDNIPQRIDTIVVSTQHDDFVEAADGKSQEKADEEMLSRIHEDVVNILIPRVKAVCGEKILALFNDKINYLVNPTGKFVIGGPHGDTGLTGRKIIVDTYGGKGAHGGGAFSGKDPSKVDRSAAYAARYIAKKMVAAGVADEMLVQIAYAIGIARPVSIFVNTNGTAAKGKDGKQMSDSYIASKIETIFDLRPAKIIEKFDLKNPIYEPTAAYGHMGRKPYKQLVKVIRNGHETEKLIQFFGWELLDSVDIVKKEFEL